MSVADQCCSTGNADEANADTLELELTPDEMLTLTRAAALQERPASSIGLPPSASLSTPPANEGFRAPDAAADPKGFPRGFSMRMAAALGLAVAMLLVGAWTTYFASHRPIPTTAVMAEVHVPAAEPSPLLPAPAERLPVRFTNPFDASEVFEFPPDTSVTEAHDAVADLLLQRARDRRQLLAKGGLRAGRHPPRAMTAQNSPRPQ